jgi:hypothetical protein
MITLTIRGITLSANATRNALHVDRLACKPCSKR